VAVGNSDQNDVAHRPAPGELDRSRPRRAAHDRLPSRAEYLLDIVLSVLNGTAYLAIAYELLRRHLTL